MGFLDLILGFILEYKFIILFYLLIILFVLVKRKRFQFQAKFIALYRTKFGLKFIDRIGTKHAEFVKILGYCGIGLGYTGMLVIMGFIVKGMYDLIFVPSAPPVIAPVLPGIPIPGSPITVPFWYGIIALFIVVLVHEFSHGIVARAHKIPVLNSGIVFFGPLIGAFVEPDEKKITKQSDVVKYSIFAAGPFSNMILAVIVLLITSFVFAPVINHYAHPIGFEITKLEPGMPAEEAGLETGVIYNRINNESILSVDDLQKMFDKIKVNDTIIIGDDAHNYTVTTTARNTSPEKAVIGIDLVTRFTNQNKWWLQFLLWVNGLLSWVFMLSLGLGLANLLPIGPVDGGRMIGESLQKVWGEEKGKLIWGKLTMIMIFIIVVLLFVPIIRAII
jgi:membrane-associated protease RseP (regulator of RpoE activity)